MCSTTLAFVGSIVTALTLGLCVGALFMHCVEVHHAKLK